MNIIKEAFEVLNILNSNGYEAYLVGGCVRDYLLNREIYDYDITTSATPNQICEIFKDNIKNIVGIEYGSLTINYKNVDFEVTTFRSDGGYLNHRHPDKVDFVLDLEKDLSRRDFTINSIAMDKNKKIYDPFFGENAIRNKKIFSIGDANKKISEDALRILRAIRFAGVLDFTIDDSLAIAIKNNIGLLEFVSRERIVLEFNKILLSKKPSRCLKLMADFGVFNVIFREISSMIGFNQDNPHHENLLFEHVLKVVDGTSSKLSLRLAALFHDIAKPLTKSFDDAGVAHYYGHDDIGSEMAFNILKEYKYSNDICNLVRLLIKEHMSAPEVIGDKGLRRQIQRLGKENIFLLYELMISDRLATSKNRDASFLYNRVKIIENLLEEVPISKSFLAINGDDIIKLGYGQGPIIGEILNRLNEIVLDNPKLNNRDDLINIVKRW